MTVPIIEMFINLYPNSNGYPLIVPYSFLDKLPRVEWNHFAECQRTLYLYDEHGNRDKKNSALTKDTRLIERKLKNHGH